METSHIQGSWDMTDETTPDPVKISLGQLTKLECVWDIQVTIWESHSYYQETCCRTGARKKMCTVFIRTVRSLYTCDSANGRADGEEAVIGESEFSL